MIRSFSYHFTSLWNMVLIFLNLKYHIFVCFFSKWIKYKVTILRRIKFFRLIYNPFSLHVHRFFKLNIKRYQSAQKNIRYFNNKIIKSLYDISQLNWKILTGNSSQVSLVGLEGSQLITIHWSSICEIKKCLSINKMYFFHWIDKSNLNKLFAK